MAEIIDLSSGATLSNPVTFEQRDDHLLAVAYSGDTLHFDRDGALIGTGFTVDADTMAPLIADALARGVLTLPAYIYTRDADGNQALRAADRGPLRTVVGVCAASFPEGTIEIPPVTDEVVPVGRTVDFADLGLTPGRVVTADADGRTVTDPAPAVGAGRDADPERDDMVYERGKRAALLGVLRHVLQELGVESTEAGRARWVIERERIVAALRDVCDEYGDNEWSEGIGLDDVIEKHLRRHLDAGPFTPPG
jgi:hypothetical protein